MSVVDMPVDIAPVTYAHVTPDGEVRKSYAMTREDVHWLAKSLWGECEAETERHCGAVAWTMMRRWMTRRGRKLWSDFTDFMRAFSEPVDPDEVYRDRPRKIQGWTWAEIPKEAREYAIAFAEGRLSDPLPWSVNFAAQSLARKKGFTGTAVGRGPKNVFIDKKTDAWVSDWVYWPGTLEILGGVPGGGGVDVDVDHENVDQDVDSETMEEARPFPSWAIVAGAAAALVLVAGAAIALTSRKHK